MKGTEHLQALVTLLSLRDGHTQGEENIYEARFPKCTCSTPGTE